LEQPTERIIGKNITFRFVYNNKNKS